MKQRMMRYPRRAVLHQSRLSDGQSDYEEPGTERQEGEDPYWSGISICISKKECGSVRRMKDRYEDDRRNAPSTRGIKASLYHSFGGHRSL